MIEPENPDLFLQKLNRPIEKDTYVYQMQRIMGQRLKRELDGANLDHLSSLAEVAKEYKPLFATLGTRPFMDRVLERVRIFAVRHPKVARLFTGQVFNLH